MQRVRSTEGCEVAVHDLGGRGPLVLLAHATGFHGHVWAPFARCLSDRYHCVAVDFRGHGDSVVPDDHPFHWDRFGDDVLAVVDHLGAGRLLGVGHSKGGAALVLAELRRPGLFRGLWLYEPIIFPADGVPGRDADGPNPMAEAARRRREGFPSRAAAVENYASKPPLDALHPDALRAYVDHGFEDLADGTVRLKCRGEHEGRVYTMSSSHRAWDDLDTLGCPVVVGTGDDGMPALVAGPVAERIRQGRLARFDGLGHFGPLQDPARVAEAVAAFFAEVA